MKSSGSNSWIRTTIRDEPINTFPLWKSRRKFLVSTLGPTFLTLTENELSNLFADLENDLRELSQVNKPEDEMMSLLEISILHFFRRSYDQIKNLFPIINNLTASSSRDVCRASTTTLRYLAAESIDNYSFLRESLESAKSYLHPQQKPHLIYSALSILREVGRFLPNEVFGVTVSHFPEIWNAALSEDIGLRYVAIKIIKIHLFHLPTNIQITFVESLFMDCNSTLTTTGKSPDAYHGAVLVYRTIYKLSPTAFTDAKIIQMIEKMITVSLSPNDYLTISIFDFIKDLCNERPKAITSKIASDTITSIMAQIMNGYGLPDLFEILNEFIELFTDKKIFDIPLFPIIEMVEQLSVNPEYSNYTNDIFSVLLILFKIFPKANASINLFKNSTPCINYIKAIRLRPSYLHELKEKLMDLFVQRLNSKSSEEGQIVSIFMVKTFDKLLFELNDALLEMLRPLTFSKYPKVRFYMTQTLPLFNNNTAFNELNRMAVMDSDKSVRMSALKEIKPEFLTNNHDSLTQLLADPSYRIRREAIPLIAKSALTNSIYTIPFIVLFVSNFFAKNLAYNNPSKSAKACSLLPNIAEFFTCFSPPSIPTLVWVCLSFLYHGQPIPDLNNSNASTTIINSASFSSNLNENESELTSNSSSDITRISIGNQIAIINELGGFTQVDIHQVIHRDFTSDGYSASSSSNYLYDPKSMHEKEYNRNKVYQVENEKWLEKRDLYLFQTLGKITNNLLPYLVQVIPAFILCFSEKHSDNVYNAAIDSLTKIVRSSESRFNFMNVFPDLLPCLHNLLSNDNIGQDVAISIMKLTGTIGASRSIKFIKMNEKSEREIELVFSSKKSSFFTSFVMTMLINMLSGDPSPSVFEAITRIIVKDTDNSLPYLGPVINGFINAIGSNSEADDLLFNQLEMIVNATQLHMTPFMKNIQKVLIDNFTNLNCVRVCVVLSYFLKTEFNEIAAALYPIALHHMSSSNKASYFKVVVKFAVFVILYSNENAELFIETIELLLNSNNKSTSDDSRISFLLKSLSTLFQKIRLNMFTARIARLCFNLFEMKRTNCYNETYQLLFNLCIFGHLSLDLIEQIHPIPHLDELRQASMKGSLMIDDFNFVKRFSPGISSEHLSNVLSPMIEVTKDVFQKIPKPVFNNSRQWIDDICILVVENSPYVAIRSCSKVIEQSQALRQEIFPIAFLSCWNSASKEDQKTFSNTIKMILSFENIDSHVISLAEFVDRAGYPLLIPDNEIAENCHSTALSLYYLQRFYLDGHYNKETIQQLLQLNSRMGRIESARGLLASISRHGKVDPIDIDMGKWSEELGEWEKALEIYESKTPRDVNELLQCYAQLEQWDTICKLSTTFDQMSKEDKIRNAPWFAWAYYHAKDLDKMIYYLDIVPLNQRKNRDYLFFKTIYLIASKKFDEAQSYIENGFVLLTDKLSVFNGSDANEASKRMVFAQHLIELNEALEMCKNDIVEAPEIWQNRLRNFSHDSDAWMKLLEIRSLVMSPADHSESYLKMLSVLRKERRWKLIDVYCERFFSNSPSPAVLLVKLKILWSRGSKARAVSILRSINQILQSRTLDEFKEIYLSIPQEDVEFIKSSIAKTTTTTTSSSGLKNRPIEEIYIQMQKTFGKIDQKFFGRLIRIQANWQYRLYTSKTSPASTLIDISQLFEQSNKLVSNDYRTWAGWAYTSSRALSHFSELRTRFTVNAISGFLKATQLRPSESLEYLCQMFSIFFRYGEEIELPMNIKKDIVSLPPTIINQIIPQIVVHISHKDKNVREVVQAIINNFGSMHFQAVVFALNVLSLIGNGETSSIATSIIEELGSKCPKTYSDAKLFIDGMHRSAVSWLEQWLTTLDTASRAQQANDRESVIQFIQQQYDKWLMPQCEIDRQFINNFGQMFQRSRILFEKYKTGDVTAIRPMWDSFRSLFAELDDKMKKTETILLPKVSEELANKRNFHLAIPGTYSVESTSPQLHYIEPALHVLSTQQHPRIVYMCDTEGVRWKFLLKGNEDLRLDQRIMQFFNLINSLIMTNRNTLDLDVSILKYAIVPFAPNAGLITWVTGADTFQQLVIDYRHHRDMRQSIELEISQQYVGNIFNSLSALQRYEIFNIVSSQTRANELREMLWLRSPDPSSWLQRNWNFTISTALMSMAGYTIGLGDRHPSNIMVQRHTGRVIHIDFGDSFEVANNRVVFAERVPFRMTRMIVNALDGGSVDGLFRRSCQELLWVLRENQSSVIAQLEVFVHEPIFKGREIRSNEKEQKGILEKVASKLSGRDPEPFDNPNIELDVEQQVDTLIKLASDPKEYVRHYIGWCPFW